MLNMSHFDKAIIAVDYTDFDPHLFKYTAAFKKVYSIQSIEVVHVLPHKSLFLNSSSDQGASGSDYDSLQQEITSGIKRIAAENGIHLQDDDICIIDHDRPFRAIKQYIEDNPVDLLIIGKKDQSKHSGLTAKKVAHHLSCDILLVCESSDYNIKRALVPFDYDPYSANALKHAAKLPDDVEKTAFHVVRVLDRDHYYGISLSPGYDKQALKIDDEASAKFFSSLQIDLEQFKIEKSVENYHRIAYKIKETQQALKADLVIIGAKGHTVLENFLIGSTTEKLVHIIDQGAVLIVR